MLVYGYNGYDFEFNRLGDYDEKAQWYGSTLCDPQDGLLRKIGLSSTCVPFVLSPEEIQEKLSLNASWALASQDPPILLIRQFLTLQECDRLVQLAREKGVDEDTALAAVDTNAKVDLKTRSNTRVGGPRPPHEQQSWWSPLTYEYILWSARKRLATILQTSPLTQETHNLQCTARHQQFAMHHDFSYHQVEFLFEEGPRTWTGLTYLSDAKDTKGGYTEFPLLKLKLKPEKGDIVLWPNAYHGTLIKDFRLFHAGTEVLSGRKYTYNQNFRAGRAREEQYGDVAWPYGDAESAPIRQFAEW
eukprot:CAMPEP_0170199950 /NCGR_PEP_ID=MMETSP0040_2-20121228/69616_1 /TAXON_ID=641309 /ORGANISM="Lotharella oceanica, Strain CCMP622" /LENGTH=301 /DNA_ID=CAMNT_0010450111 /DNA_START=39 /DNA_END=944 /DNA_ORIENTATION=+